MHNINTFGVGGELYMHFLQKVFDMVRNKPFSAESSVNRLAELPFSEKNQSWRQVTYT